MTAECDRRVTIGSLRHGTIEFNLQPAMFQKIVRAARPAMLATRSSLKPSTSTLRAFSTTLHVQSGGPPPPQLYGDGGKAGSVPTDMEQATGIERLQLMGELEGVKIFDDDPLDSSRIGTKVDPVLVPSYVRGDATLVIQ